MENKILGLCPDFRPNDGRKICPECQEEILVDGEYKGQVVYICPNMHRSIFTEAA